MTRPMTRPVAETGAKEEVPPLRLGLGWKIALAVWAAGFLGLFLFEIVAMLVGLGRGRF